MCALQGWKPLTSECRWLFPSLTRPQGAALPAPPAAAPPYHVLDKRGIVYTNAKNGDFRSNGKSPFCLLVASLPSLFNADFSPAATHRSGAFQFSLLRFPHENSQVRRAAASVKRCSRGMGRKPYQARLQHKFPACAKNETPQQAVPAAGENNLKIAPPFRKCSRNNPCVGCLSLL